MSNQTQFVDEMVRHYLICALWSSNDESTPEGGEPLDANYDLTDFAPKALARARKDCSEFVEQNAALLADLQPDQTGHDFWLTRNGHGAGFWDRGLGEVGRKLTESCKRFKELHAIVGDDNKIYFE